MNSIENVFDPIIGLAQPFWVNGKRAPGQGNSFYYDSGKPVVKSKYISNDDTMTRLSEECITLKANNKNSNTYRANSAICTQKKAVFCMMDKTLTTTTTEATTTITPLTTVQPVIPGESLPKMPRFCPPKREKRNALGNRKKSLL